MVEVVYQRGVNRFGDVEVFDRTDTYEEVGDRLRRADIAAVREGRGYRVFKSRQAIYRDILIPGHEITLCCRHHLYSW